MNNSGVEINFLFKEKILMMQWCNLSSHVAKIYDKIGKFFESLQLLFRHNYYNCQEERMPELDAKWLSPLY
jgi:hypothetical protein